jgi:hypothetical protein
MICTPAPVRYNLNCHEEQTAPTHPCTPQLEPQPLDVNERLRVVASSGRWSPKSAATIDLTADAAGRRSWFEPTPQDRIAIEEAVVFINGLGLESMGAESRWKRCDCPVNTGFSVLELDNETDHEEHADEDHADEDHGHEHGGDDPHTWFSVHAVEQWVENVEHVLSELDPENAETYAANAENIGASWKIWRESWQRWWRSCCRSSARWSPTTIHSVTSPTNTTLRSMARSCPR